MKLVLASTASAKSFSFYMNSIQKHFFSEKNSVFVTNFDAHIESTQQVVLVGKEANRKDLLSQISHNNVLEALLMKLLTNFCSSRKRINQI